MIKIVLFLFSFSFCNAALAQQSQYTTLLSVNANWQTQQNAQELYKQSYTGPNNEIALIQFHLAETEKLLRNKNTDHLTTTQRQQRFKLLDILHSYNLAGQFPINTQHYNRQPYFIDNYGTHCAVGYLMQQSGAASLAKEINKNYHYSFLKDIQHPALMEWVNNSGLDFDELALIQPGYNTDVQVTLLELHYNNTGTDVNEYIEIHQANGIMVSPFDSVKFYTHEGVLYKKLIPAEMSNNGLLYYYNFPANESFADSGRIEITGYNPSLSSSGILQKIEYNGDSVKTWNYLYNLSPTPVVYNIGENESTPVGNSLTFCKQPYNPFTLSSLPATMASLQSCAILPITLGEFTHIVKKEKVELQWQTLTETNTKNFTIERSAEGVNFTAIGNIAAAGNSSQQRSYRFTDTKPEYINHYRLKLTDLDGKIHYSKLLYVKVEAASALSLQQNTGSNSIQYRIAENIVNAKLEVYDMLGRNIHTRKVNGGLHNLPIADWHSGKYIVRLTTTNGNVFTALFVKQ